MLGYVAESLTRFHHNHPCKPQDQPYPHINPHYGAKAQYSEATDDSPPLSKEHKKIVQEFMDNLLYYARAVDPTMLTVLGSIAPQQANPTEKMIQKAKQLLDYVASHPDEVLTYQASEMILAIHSNASYLSETNALSRAGGHFFISKNTTFSPNNSAVFTISNMQPSTNRCERITYALCNTSGQDTKVEKSIERKRAVVREEITRTYGRDSSSTVGSD